jgi:hypothetical protein
MYRFYVSAIALVAFPLVHCMMPMMPPPQQGAGLAAPSNAGAPQTSGASGAGLAPSSAGGPSGPSSGPLSNAAPQSKAAGGAPSAPIPTSVEVHSDCPKTTPVFYGDKPKFGSGTKSSIGSNTTTSATRKSDGTLTIWIIDEQENGISSVHVEASTRRVEIDRSCRQITAR